jgi:formate C-acetyltransferase
MSYNSPNVVYRETQSIEMPGFDAAKPVLFNFSEDRTIGKYNIIPGVFLGFIALCYNYIPWLKKELTNSDGYINYKVGVATKGGEIAKTVEIINSKMKVIQGISETNNANVIFDNLQAAAKVMNGVPSDIMELMTKNEIIIDGDRSAVLFLGYLLLKIISPVVSIKLVFLAMKDKAARKSYAGKLDFSSAELSEEMKKRKNHRIQGKKGDDPGVKYLDDPYLPEYSIEDFPRVKAMHDKQMNTRPELSAERPKLLTEWFRKNGFYTDTKGNTWNPVMRQALAFNYLMNNKKPVIQDGNLIPGSTGPENVPVLLYPDTEASIALWAELESINKRVLNPHYVSKENLKILKDVLPFWRDKTIRYWVLKNFNYPLNLKIDDRTAVYFNMKFATFSHTIPNTPKILALGTSGIKKEIDDRIAAGRKFLSGNQLTTLKAMKITLDGLDAYAGNLAAEAERLAHTEKDKTRKQELIEMAEICRRVPMNPAGSLHEAFISAWIFLAGVWMENNNISLSPGRFDQFFQPYFEMDMAKINNDAERKAYIKRAVEMSACLFLRIGHHHMALPDLANYLYSGTRTDAAVTLGGVKPDGTDAVNDMTYIFLKVTEMLANQEPNMNVRFHPGINSDAYLRRVSHVNYVASGTPSMHNDIPMFESLKQHGYDIRDIRDWGATGCVEPTMSGKHTGHTNALFMNAIAGFEMAMNNGYHPLLKWQLGPKTGSIENGDFKSFDQFLNAYRTQMQFLIDNHCDLNFFCGQAHAAIRPQPFLSSVTEGCVEKALDNTAGGAKYNSSGSSNIGMADVTDSMMAIKKIVFDEKIASFPELKKAVDTDFSEDQRLYSIVRKKIPLFGSGNDESVKMANTMTKLIWECYAKHTNFRGGKYLTGFWSTSWHSAFGNLSGTLPSGRLRGKAFTPGFTPQPHASRSILDNLRDIAKLDPKYMENNIAFNVKYVPNAKDSTEKTIDNIFSYVKTYFEEGGMQMQLNMVDATTLKDAMVHPENYRNLLVRISGYSAYFVELSKELQIELIERSQFQG